MWLIAETTLEIAVISYYYIASYLVSRPDREHKYCTRENKTPQVASN